MLSPRSLKQLRRALRARRDVDPVNGATVADTSSTLDLDTSASPSALKPEERFFSIDEFGPFAVKIKGGRVLVGPGEVPCVPQFQTSKGRVLVTAALELSTNQVTHFYSTEKNTGEMLKLIDRLLDQYSDCEKLYLSWDAASWHDSHALHARPVEAINSGTYRPGEKTPKVEFVPLPSRAPVPERDRIGVQWDGPGYHP